MKKRVLAFGFLYIIVLIILSTYLANAVYVENENQENSVNVQENVFNENNFIFERTQYGEITSKFSSDIPDSKPNSYIVQLKSEPLVKSYIRTKAQSQAKRASAIGSSKNALNNEHEEAKEDINLLVGETSLSPPKDNFFSKLAYSIKKTFYKLGIKKQISMSPPINVEEEFYNTFNGFVLNDITQEQADKIKSSSYVKNVYPNMKVEAMLMDSVPLINADDVWQLDNEGNNCAESGKECITGKNVTIAIIDTGVDYTHEDLGRCTQEQFLIGSCDKIPIGYDFSGDIDITNSGDLSLIIPDNDPMDYYGHGTHVAGIAAGNGALKGVAPEAKIYAYKVFPNAFSSVIITAIERAVDPNNDGNFDDHVDVISMSLGGDGNPDDAMSQAVDNAVDAGVVAVIAAGNWGPYKNSIASPGTARKAITIGATDKQDRIARFSSRGPVIWENEAIIKPDIVAPGVSICSAQWQDAFINQGGQQCLDDEHIAISGTSMATPMVAGAAALIKQKNPEWTPEEIKMALRNTAKDLGLEINTQGYGRIDALNAVNSEKLSIAKINKISLDESRMLKIIGTANGDNFSRYKLYIASSANDFSPKDWTYLKESSNFVKDDVLYYDFSPINLSYGLYYIKLVSYKESIKSEDIMGFWIRNSLKALDGWPIKLPNNYFYYDLTLADINLDGKDEIISASHNLETGQIQINVINYKGENLDGWPKIISPYGMFGSVGYPLNMNPISIGDINGDGFPEIFFVNFFCKFKGYGDCIYAWNYDGTPINGWPKSLKTDYIPLRPAVISDVNNDGEKEIVFSAGEVFANKGINHLFVLDENGTELLNIDSGVLFKDLNFSVVYLSNPVIFDINNDGEKEIVFSSSVFIKSQYPYYLYYINAVSFNNNLSINFSKNVFNTNGLYDSLTFLYAIKNKNLKYGLGEIKIQYFNNFISFTNTDGNFLNGWPWPKMDRPIFNPSEEDTYLSTSHSSFADVDNDGLIEIILGYGSGYYGSPKVIILDDKGVIKNGWPNDIDSPAATFPKIVDFNNDGKKEIVTISENGILYIWNFAGYLLFSTYLLNNQELGISFGDINGDGFLEMITANNNQIYAWLTKAEKNDDKDNWLLFGKSPDYDLVVSTKEEICTNIPRKPTELRGGVLGGGSLRRIWRDNSNNEDGFEIERRTGNSGEFALIASVPADINNYNDSGLLDGARYCYKVRAYNCKGYSNYSDIDCINTPLATPSNLTASSVSGKKINLAWQDNSNNEKEFKIERSLKSASGFKAIKTLPADSNEYTDSGLTKGKKYYYRIIAVRKEIGVNSDYSNTASAIAN